MTKGQEPVDVFSARLREVREARGLNQRELAERLGIPPSQIAHFEGGRRKPSFENLQLLSEALDVSTDYLLGRAESSAVLPADDPLVRDLSKLRAQDREVVEAVVRVLSKKPRRTEG